MSILYVRTMNEFQKIAKALSIDIRIKIYELLQIKPYNINDIAEKLGVPTSTISINIKKLEKADLITTITKAAEKGGLQKVCSVKYGKIIFEPKPTLSPIREMKILMPIGNFVNFKVKIPCGISSEKKIIGKFDDIPSFYQAEKTDAQIIWFTQGFLEYHFPNKIEDKFDIKSLEFSAEICSEAKGYDNEHKSDITLWINNCEVGTWTSPGDFGGKKGKNNPKWWKNSFTQYGLLTCWKITDKGSFINEKHSKKCTLEKLELYKNPYISIKIGIKEDAENIGGMNLFGSKFGNFNQDLMIIINYKEK